MWYVTRRYDVAIVGCGSLGLSWCLADAAMLARSMLLLCGRADLDLCSITYLFPTDLFFDISEIGSNSWLTICSLQCCLHISLSDVHVNSWIWFVAPLIAITISCEKLMLFLFWSGFCMAESWARTLSLCLKALGRSLWVYPKVMRSVVATRSVMRSVFVSVHWLTELTDAARFGFLMSRPHQ